MSSRCVFRLQGRIKECRVEGAAAKECRECGEAGLLDVGQVLLPAAGVERVGAKWGQWLCSGCAQNRNAVRQHDLSTKAALG